MAHFTKEAPLSDIPTQREEGASSSAAPAPSLERRMNTFDEEGNLWSIFLPHSIANTDEEIRGYFAYLGSLSVSTVSSTFSAADIPKFRERYQIPSSVTIRAPER